MLCAVNEDVLEFVTWDGPDSTYPLWFKEYQRDYVVNPNVFLGGKNPFGEIMPGDVFIRNKFNQIRFVTLNDFTANWFVLDGSNNGCQLCALVSDTLEFVYWEGTDAIYPYWFITFMFDMIDCVSYGNATYSDEGGTYVVMPMDVFVCNRLGELKYYSYLDFNNLYLTVK